MNPFVGMNSQESFYFGRRIFETDDATAGLDQVFGGVGEAPDGASRAASQFQ